jgi:hypothetical protein
MGKGESRLAGEFEVAGIVGQEVGPHIWIASAILGESSPVQLRPLYLLNPDL